MLGYLGVFIIHPTLTSTTGSIHRGDLGLYSHPKDFLWSLYRLWLQRNLGDGDDGELNVLRCWADVLGPRENLGWLVECCFTSTETVGLLGWRGQDGHLDIHTAPEL